MIVLLDYLCVEVGDSIRFLEHLLLEVFEFIVDLLESIFNEILDLGLKADSIGRRSCDSLQLRIEVSARDREIPKDRLRIRL